MYRALGMTPGAEAFEYSPAQRLMAHSAMTLRAELPVHRNSTLYWRLARVLRSGMLLRFRCAATGTGRRWDGRTADLTFLRFGYCRTRGNVVAVNRALAEGMERLPRNAARVGDPPFIPAGVTAGCVFLLLD